MYKRSGNLMNPNVKLSFKNNFVNVYRPNTREDNEDINMNGQKLRPDRARSKDNDPLLNLKKTNSDVSVKMNKITSFGLQKEKDINKISMILKKTHSRSHIGKI